MENINPQNEDNDLDPRIQIELEKLNTATDDINKLEIELDEANTTFRMLLNESTRRLKVLGKKLGSCIEKARPYYEALEEAKKAQLECQTAAVLFQRANEIHAAAKETVALAEQRFMSNSHEWQFDNAWQEMLNHATIKVMDAENQKAASGREHQIKAMCFNTAEQKVQHLEERLRRHIIKSRPYFEEKTLCQEQLNTQKDRVESLQKSVSEVKYSYSQSLKKLELISEEIHQKRRNNRHIDDDIPSGPREPGVGAELNSPTDENRNINLAFLEYDIENCEPQSYGNSATPSSAVSERDESEEIEDVELNDLRLRVKQLAVRPIDGIEGCSDYTWESELNATVDKLDHMLLMKECSQNQLKNDLPIENTPENQNSSRNYYFESENGSPVIKNGRKNTQNSSENQNSLNKNPQDDSFEFGAQNSFKNNSFRHENYSSNIQNENTATNSAKKHDFSIDKNQKDNNFGFAAQNSLKNTNFRHENNTSNIKNENTATNSARNPSNHDFSVDNFEFGAQNSLKNTGIRHENSCSDINNEKSGLETKSNNVFLDKNQHTFGAQNSFNNNNFHHENASSDINHENSGAKSAQNLSENVSTYKNLQDIQEGQNSSKNHVFLSANGSTVIKNEQKIAQNLPKGNTVDVFIGKNHQEVNFELKIQNSLRNFDTENSQKSTQDSLKIDRNISEVKNQQEVNFELTAQNSLQNFDTENGRKSTQDPLKSDSNVSILKNEQEVNFELRAQNSLQNFDTENSQKSTQNPLNNDRHVSVGKNEQEVNFELRAQNSLRNFDTKNGSKSTQDPLKSDNVFKNEQEVNFELRAQNSLQKFDTENSQKSTQNPLNNDRDVSVGKNEQKVNFELRAQNSLLNFDTEKGPKLTQVSLKSDNVFKNEQEVNFELRAQNSLRNVNLDTESQKSIQNLLKNGNVSVGKNQKEITSFDHEAQNSSRMDDFNSENGREITEDSFSDDISVGNSENVNFSVLKRQNLFRNDVTKNENDKNSVQNLLDITCIDGSVDRSRENNSFMFEAQNSIRNEVFETDRQNQVMNEGLVLENENLKDVTRSHRSSKVDISKNCDNLKSGTE